MSTTFLQITYQLLVLTCLLYYYGAMFSNSLKFIVLSTIIGLLPKLVGYGSYVDEFILIINSYMLK
jgi:hypothetical protein